MDLQENVVDETDYQGLVGEMRLKLEDWFRKRILVSILLASVTSLWGQEAIAEKDSLIDGKTLASQYCMLCHELPNPDLLSKKSWEFALTYMGFYLGIVDYAYLEGSSERTMDSIYSRGLYK